MTDRPGDAAERNDPVLVRPYVNTGEEDDPPPGGDTWPAEEDDAHPSEPAEEDDPSPYGRDQPTAVQPAIVVPPLPPARRSPEPRSHPLHWSLRLLVLLAGVAVALGIAAYFVRGGGSQDDARRGPSVSLPAVGPAAPAVGAVTSAAKPSASARSSSPSPSASSSASRSPRATEPTGRTPATRKPTLAPPPASDRTGRIGSASGRCLTLGGLLGIDGSPIETASCTGGTSQRFTLATDGTLQVAGRCAAADGDGSVRSDGCGSAGDSGQWRAGPDGSLVNTSSGRCLTDPGRAGATTTTATCTGGSDQRWSLP
jgi:hypothetical protein